MTLIELVEEFATSVAHQSSAIELGDAATGNKYAKRYIAAFEKLRERGDEGRDALAKLLHDDRPDVRIMAAAYLLRYKESEATAILAAAAAGSRGFPSRASVATVEGRGMVSRSS